MKHILLTIVLTLGVSSFFVPLDVWACPGSDAKGDTSGPLKDSKR